VRLAIATAFVAAVAVVTMLPDGRARACSCVEFTLETALADGDAAFVGTVAAEIAGSPAADTSQQARGWRFDVEAVVKGDVAGPVEVWQASEGSCGPSFDVGQRAGVIVRREGDRYAANDCGGVWLPDELLYPGAVAAPTGGGPVALIAAGRSGPAVLASYDAGGNLAAWALGERADELTHLQVCPGSTTFVGLAGWDEPRLVRRDVASLAVTDTVVLPERAESSWPMMTDPRALHCVSSDGDVMFLVSASGYGDGGRDNVVVWVDGATALVHPVDHGWGLAPAGDGASAVLLTGSDGGEVERFVLADGSRQAVARLPDGLGGRLVSVDPNTGRMAIVATTNPSLHARGDPAAPDDRLVVLAPDGAVQSVAELAGPRLADSVDWLDPEHVRIVWSLPHQVVEVVGVDGTVQSTTALTAAAGVVVADGRVYAGTAEGVEEVGSDGGRRMLAPGIARVNAVVAVPRGPVAAPQTTPTIPAAAPTTAPVAAPATTPATTAQPSPATTAPTEPTPASLAAAAEGPTDPDSGSIAPAAIAGLVAVVVAGVAVTWWWRRRRSVA
jgi:hypothetical protein